MTSQKHPMLTLTIDFDAADKNHSALDSLHQAEAVINAICTHATPVVHVIANGTGEYFAEELQAIYPTLTFKKVYRCTPCACSTNPQQKERMCFRLQ